MRTSERAGGVSPVALRKPDKRGCKSPPLTLCGILMPSRGGARRPPSLKHLQSWKRRDEWIEMASLGGQNGCYYDCYSLQPLLSIPSVPSLLEEKTHTVAATREELMLCMSASEKDGASGTRRCIKSKFCVVFTDLYWQCLETLSGFCRLPLRRTQLKFQPGCRFSLD